MTTSSILGNLLKDYQSAYSSASQAAQSNGTSSTASTSETSTATNDSAYILDLTDAAQQLLDSQNTSGLPETISLSDNQKEKLKSILDKYKDQPVNDETLAALQNDLQRAGLTPETLSQVEQLKNFNPTLTLIKILYGSDSENSEGNSDIFGSITQSQNNISSQLQKYVDASKQFNSGSSGTSA